MKASQIVVVLSSVLVACVVVVVDAGTNKSIAPTPTVTRPGTMPPVGGSGTPPPVATDTLPPITPFPTEATDGTPAPVRGFVIPHYILIRYIIYPISLTSLILSLIIYISNDTIDPTDRRGDRYQLPAGDGTHHARRATRAKSHPPQRHVHAQA